MAVADDRYPVAKAAAISLDECLSAADGWMS